MNATPPKLRKGIISRLDRLELENLKLKESINWLKGSQQTIIDILISHLVTHGSTIPREVRQYIKGIKSRMSDKASKPGSKDDKRGKDGKAKEDKKQDSHKKQDHQKQRVRR